MSRMFLRAMALALGLCMFFAQAFAVDATILDEPEGDDWRNVIAQAVAGDTLYMLISSEEGQQLWHWKEDMPKAQPLADGVYYASYFSSMEEVEQSLAAVRQADGTAYDPQYVMTSFFSDGERLYGLNGYNGKIFAVTAEDGKVRYEDLAAIADVSPLYHVEEEFSYFLNTDQLAMAGEKLLYAVQDYDPATGMPINKLLVIDVKTGEMKESAVKFVQRVSPYKDGKALLICRDDDNAYNAETETWEKPDVMVYDPAADTAEKAAKLNMQWISSPFAYSSQLDALVYVDNCRIMAMPGLGEAVQVGYLPTQYMNQAMVLGDSIISTNDGLVRTISTDFRSDVSLNLYGDWMDQGTMAFIAKYPQVPVYPTNDYYNSMEQISQAMVSGDTTIDVLRMSVDGTAFLKLMEKGYCADLSGNAELMTYAERLYPIYRDAVMKDGKLYAIPLHAYSYDGWFAATGVMEEMGLTADDLPTNFVELCQFATRWNDEWVEEFPQFTLIEYCNDYKTQIFHMMMSAYVDYYVAKDMPLRFDTPEFRAMMTALEAMRVDDLNRGSESGDEDEIGYRQGLFMPGYSVVGNFTMEQSEYRIFTPMAIGPEQEYVTGASLEVVFINPKCANMKEAMDLLLCKAQAVDSENNINNAYTLLADKTEPVENKHFEEVIRNSEEMLANMKETVASLPPEEQKDMQMSIDSETRWLENYKVNQRWTISEEGVRTYREDVMPHVYVDKPDVLNGADSASSELFTLMERYLAGQIKVDQFIRDADNKLLMMQMEDY